VNEPLSILEQYFGYDRFRPQQKEIIEHVVSGRDALALLPTGGGKSICYQVPALMIQGICVVVSPLVALIRDQVDQLRSKGVKAIGITGGLSYRELDDILDNCIYGNYKLLYLSPERAKQELVRERLSRMDINLFAVDEAHCISEWGHDFRPAYLQINELRELKPSVPMLALTATATPQVQNDICEYLNLKNHVTFKTSYERQNISYLIHRTSDKRKTLVELSSKDKENSIVYVRSRKNTAEYAQLLNHYGVRSSFYHGGLENKSRQAYADDWMKNNTHVMVATSAFGMGIDKPDVRKVIHLQLPESLESYYQETGRAGRDGKPSDAHFIYNPNDIDHAYNQFVKNLPDGEYLKKLYRDITSYLQIALGEGSGETFAFNFADFVNKYDHSGLKVYSGLGALERFGVLELSQNFDRLSRVRFRESATIINNFTQNRPEQHAVIQAILRSYGSSQFQSLQINPKIIAARSGTTEGVVKNTLMLLDKHKLADVELADSSFSLTFLVPREDSRTINRFKPKLDSHLKLKQAKLRAMIAYVREKRQCLNNVLLSYFGENKTERCGRCSNCLKNTELSKRYSSPNEVLNLLKKQALTVDDITHQLELNQADLIEHLRVLLDEQKIQMTPDRRYIAK
jgi:ATP-dependent DNA helicase RecQ